MTRLINGGSKDGVAGIFSQADEPLWLHPMDTVMASLSLEHMYGDVGLDTQVQHIFAKYLNIYVTTNFSTGLMFCN